MKTIKISKATYSNIIDAWSKMNMLCCYLESEKRGDKFFTEKFSLQEHASEIYKRLDAVVTKLPDLNE